MAICAQICENPVDIATGKPLSAGEPETTKISEVYTFLRRPSAKTLAKSGVLECLCPNCGAPIEIGQVTVCKNCNGFIRSGYYDWILVQINHSYEWKYSNPAIIPNWNKLKELDKNICIQQLEEKASVIFWNLKNTEISRNALEMVRFATPEFLNAFKSSMNNAIKEYTNYENISLASMSIRAVDINDNYVDVYLLATWSGIPVKYDESGRVLAFHRYSNAHKELLILRRNKNAVTKKENALTGAHCPNCGGPLNSSFEAKCSYCSTILNDGSEWVLSKISNENNMEYAKLLHQRYELVEDAVVKITAEKKDERLIEPHSASEVISIASQLMLADGVIASKEMELLKGMAVKMRIPETKLTEIVESVKSGRIPKISLTGRSFMEAKVLFDTALEMAFADDTISSEEEASLIQLGHTMGYGANEVKNRIKKYEMTRLKAKSKKI